MDAGTNDPEGLATRVQNADAFVHLQDLPETDLLLAADYATHEAGFSAAQAITGGKAALYLLDARDPENPHARTLTEEIARVVRARAANPRWIDGMMRHGFRGGAEIAATLDQLGAFAHLAASVPPQLIDLYHQATLGRAARRWPLGDAAQFHSGGVGDMSFEVKGWCPGAHRPMMSGDGYVVRVRPRLARLTAAQAVGLCEAAMRHGAGLIDVTNRANIQIRGVTEPAWPLLMAELETLDLLDPDAGVEARRNIVVAPDWAEGDNTQRITSELLARLHELPALPPKMGFAIDAGAGPMLAETSSDFRLERGVHGGLILRADGRAMGAPVPVGAEVDALIALAMWLLASDGAQAGRMARHSADLRIGRTGLSAPPRPAPHCTPVRIGWVRCMGWPLVRSAPRIYCGL